MFGIDIVELSAIISERLTQWSPLEIKVTKVINKSTFEIAPATSPFLYDGFWGDDYDHAILTPEEKLRCYLQMHRSTDCNDHVFALVTALKQFCDTGIPLQYEQDKVVDIWVINADSFDIRDLVQTRSLKLRDPKSGYAVRFPPTLESMELLSNITTDVRKRLRLSALDISSTERCRKLRDTKAYENTTPHWWVAAILEGERDGTQKRRMVHIDICGAAYDDEGLRSHGGSLVSLQVFTTPEFSLIPGEEYLGVTGGDVSKMFFMTSKLAQSYVDSQSNSLQPKSVRHFRCYQWEGFYQLGIANIGIFLEYGRSSLLGDPLEWSRIVSEIRHRLVLRAPSYTKVFMCNLVARSDLNGNSGYIHSSVSAHPPSDRIPVCVEGVNTTLRVTTRCLSFTKSKGFTSFSELSTRVQREIDKTLVSKEQSDAETEDQSTELSQQNRTGTDEAAPSFKTASTMKEVEDFAKSLATDPEVSAAFNALVTGKVRGSLYLDSSFVNGMTKLHSLSYGELLPASVLTRLKDFLEVSHHPKSAEAIKILRLCDVGKQKAMTPNPEEACGDADLNPNHVSQFYRLLSSIAEKIRADEQLGEIFEMMDRKGLFPNPLSQISDLETQLLAAYLLW